VAVESEEVVAGDGCFCVGEVLVGFSPKPLPDANRAHCDGTCSCDDFFDKASLGN